MMQAKTGTRHLSLGPAGSIPLPGIVAEPVGGASAVENGFLPPRVERQDDRVTSRRTTGAQEPPALAVPSPEIVQPALPVAAPEHQRHASFVVIRHGVTTTRGGHRRDRLRRRCCLRDKKRDGDCQWKTHARPCRQRKCFPRGARSNVMDRPPDGGEGRLFVTECGHGPQIGARTPDPRDPRTRDLFYGFRYVNEPSRSSAP